MKYIDKIKRAINNASNMEEIIEKKLDYSLKMLQYSLLYDIYAKGVNGCQKELFRDVNGNEHEVIVSLTTYSKRINSVHFTILSILQQTVRPNRIVLWLDEKEFTKETVPKSLRVLERYGLEIGFCANTRSFKKLVPTLERYPESTIITIDDDTLYGERTIELLLHAYLANPEHIYFCSGSRMALDKGGGIVTYTDFWKQGLVPFVADKTNFPTGCGGILYPPHSLDDEVFNSEVFMNICPTADDVWFKAMALKRGTLSVYVPLPKPVMQYNTTIKEGQDIALNIDNVANNKNDQYIKNVFERYNLYALLKSDNK